MHFPQRVGVRISDSVATVTLHQPYKSRERRENTHEEKRIRGEEIGKHRPPDDTVHADTFADQDRQYHAEELVPTVSK